MKQLIDFLIEKLGSNVVGLILVAIIGGTVFYTTTEFFVTKTKLDSKCSDMAFAMEQGDSTNLYHILSLQIESLQREKMQIENFVLVNQRGNYTDQQRSQINDLNNKIQKLEQRRDEVIKRLSDKSY